MTATLPTHDEAGVDLTLIRWALSMTPAERLRAAVSAIGITQKADSRGAGLDLREEIAPGPGYEELSRGRSSWRLDRARWCGYCASRC